MWSYMVYESPARTGYYLANTWNSTQYGH